MSRPAPLLLLALALAPLPQAAAANEAAAYDRVVLEGRQLYFAGRYEEAIARFSRAREMDPTRWQAHAWQSLGLVQRALAEADPHRKRTLLNEAESLTGPLVKQAGLMFQDPLRHYLLGLIQNVRGNRTDAYEHFRRAFGATRAQLARYDEIELAENVERGYGLASMRLAQRILLEGRFEVADRFLKDALRALRPYEERGMQGALAELYQHIAVVDEQLGRVDAAIGHLRDVIRLSPDNEGLKWELTAVIANIHFKNQRLEKGRELLAKIPPENSNPEVIAVRCAALKLAAIRAPDEPVMDRALAFYRDAMRDYPPEDVYRLVEDYGELVLEKVPPSEPEEHRGLIEETMELLEREQKKRPECPGLYFLLSRCHRLLGNTEEAAEWKRLHEIKKKEWEGKAHFDSRGRPRCSSAG